jgi:hypothetical protein
LLNEELLYTEDELYVGKRLRNDLFALAMYIFG